ncbi:helicase SNF2 [Acidovorax sp. 1608163]|uniref:DEAD/DEAH box helicase n=1 Tax=Acidovorax sp. 1608163 TaxID=2478662 RepID=UPI000EF6FC4E|nr:DEAD/DEAH box helicase [Acidovorax sp. 1608163]AYM95873.1 helicase SNF2 [Acidovorax sp. 1608163]
MSDTFWFDPDSLRALCEDGPWMRGKALLAQGVVSEPDIEPLDEGWRIQALVQGTQHIPYEVAVTLAVMPDGQVDYWRSVCDCPVGRQCKHAVALMLKAARLPLSDEARAAAAPRKDVSAAAASLSARERMAAVQQAEAQAQLVNWLAALDRAAGGDVVLSPTDRSARPEQYLYLASVVGGARQPTQLQLEAVVSYPKLTGGWAKPKQVRTQPAKGQAVYDQASETDRQVLQLLRAMPRSQGYYSAYSGAPCAVLEGQVGLLALQQAASTGRLFADAGGSTVGEPLRFAPARALQWLWREVPAQPGALSAEPAWQLRAALAGDGGTLCHNSPPLFVDAERGECGPVDLGTVTAAQLDVLLKAPALRVSAIEKYQDEMARSLPHVPLPPVVQGVQRVQGVVPRPCLHLAPTPLAQRPTLGLVMARLSFDYAGHRGWWPGQGAQVMVVPLDGGDGPRVLLQRHPQAELEAIQKLMALGLLATDDGVFGLPGERSQQAWMPWADAGFVVFSEAGFDVTQDPALQGWVSHAQNLTVALAPQPVARTAKLGHEGGGEAQGLPSPFEPDAGRTGVSDALPNVMPDEAADTSPWFSLSLGVELDGQRHNVLPWLPDLIAQAAQHPPDAATGQPQLPPFVYVPRGDAQGGFVRLPTEPLRPWLAALLELVGERGADFAQPSLRLSRLEALRASAALGEGAVWQGAAALQALVRQLQGASPIAEVPVPASVHASLRPYQQQGLNWLQFLRAQGLGGILADDMGLGKTLQTLAHIQVEKDAGRLTAPALVIAPVSLMGNWHSEAARFCPGLRTLVLHGAGRHELADSVAEHDLVIAPYSLLQRDRERWLQLQWHLVVLDEAQNIKNASTNAAQVVSALQARHRLCLSGTPMENHLGEIWSLFHFLMPGFLGSQQRFRELFRNPVEKQGDSGRLAQLRARVAPFMLRRTKALVASELPPKVETVMRVELTGAQADLYETIRLGMEKTVREALHSKGLAKSQITILDALLKLRQVCCDPHLVPLESARQVRESAKMAQLMELLPEMLAEGRRVLLFSQFTSMLGLIEAELKARGLPWVKLTGQSQKRDEIIQRFTSGEVPLFLISLKAGGVGLNLPQADTVIHYDPWWNPAAEAQATDRAHRIGQTQRLWVVKMVAQGTIEERILALQERKAQLAQAIYGGDAARKEPLFTEADLHELLQPLSAL